MSKDFQHQPDDGKRSVRGRDELIARLLSSLDLIDDPDSFLNSSVNRSGATIDKLLSDLETAGKLSNTQRFAIEQLAGTVFTSANRFDEELHATVSIDTGAHFDDSTKAGSEVLRPPADFKLEEEPGDYEILGEIAKGGMGVVYKARQKKLNRIVALKMIRSADLADEEQVRRFLVEAEAAAKLDHPGIVSVYDVGKLGSDHYYSMAYVEGESLWERVSKSGPLLSKDAARLTRDAAEALQHAHSKAIIHRDIKPQNLLVDEQEQVRIADFGLAKLQQAGNELTTAGQILGTPAYMPPEQATGDGEQVGATADIYSLGATLYFLLTGRPPFQSSTIQATLNQVLHADPVSPRSLNPTVPKDLVTICMKCLEKDPQQRYQTSLELSEELQRFLRGEPILASPLGLVGRTLRWSKRKPVVATLSLLVVLLGLAVCIAVGVGYAQTSLALADKEEQTRIAERRGSQARQAVSNYVKLVTEEDLLREKDFAPFLKSVLADALTFNQQLVQEFRNQPNALEELAQAYNEIAYINDALGHSEESIRAFQLTIETYENLSGQHPDRTEFRSTLATCHLNLGIIHERLGHLEEALMARQQAVTISRKIAKAESYHGQWAHYARSLFSLAYSYRAFGRDEEMQQVIDEALEIYERLEKRGYESEKLAIDVIITRSAQANLMLRKGQYSDAIEFLNDTLEKSDAYHEHYGTSIDIKVARADCLECMAQVQSKRDEWDDAIRYQREAVDLFDQLYGDFPLQERFRRSLAIAYGQLGELLAESGDLVEGIRWLDRSLEIQQQLKEIEWNVPELWRWARIQNRRAVVLMDHGDFTASEEAFEHSIELFDQLLSVDPDFASGWSGLADAHHNYGLLRNTQGKLEQALERFERAKDIRAQFSRDQDYLIDDRSARTFHALYSIHKKLGDDEQALNWLREAIGVREQLLTHQMRLEIALRLLTDLRLMAAALQRHETTAAAANEYIERAFDLAAQINDAFPSNRDGLHNQAWLHYLRSSQPDIRDTEKEITELKIACELWQQFNDNGQATTDSLEAAMGAHFNLGRRYEKQDSKSSALPCYENAARCGEQLLELEPDTREHQNAVALSNNAVGLLQKANRDWQKALNHLQRAEELWRDMWQADPSHHEYLIDLAGAVCNQANTFRSKGDANVAIAKYSEAKTLLEPELTNIPNPEKSKAVRYLINCYGGSAELMLELGQVKESLQAWNRIIELSSNNQRDTFRRQRLELYPRLGDYDRFESELEDLLNSHKDSDTWKAWGATTLLSVTNQDSPSATGSMELSDETQERFRTRAIGLLSELQTGTPRERLNWLLKEPRFEAVRNREDFQALIKDLENQL